MKKLFGFITILTLVFGVSVAFAQETMQAEGVTDKVTSSEEPEHYNFPEAGTTKLIKEEEVREIIKTHGSDLLIVNFWATWCGPCVEEMPYFVQLSKEYKNDRVRVVGFSVDLDNQIESRVIPFLKKEEIPYSNVVLLVDQEAIIEMMSKNWGGVIPATFFFNADGELIGEFLGPVEYKELKEKTEKMLEKASSPETSEEE